MQNLIEMKIIFFYCIYMNQMNNYLHLPSYYFMFIVFKFFATMDWYR